MPTVGVHVANAGLTLRMIPQACFSGWIWLRDRDYLGHAPMMQQRELVIRIVGSDRVCGSLASPTARVLQCKVHSSI